MPSFLRIVRESAAGDDVTGNTTVALSMTTDPELILEKANIERLAETEKLAEPRLTSS